MVPEGHLENGHFIPELALLLGGEAQFVDDFYCNVSASLPVFSCGQGIEKGKIRDQDLSVPSTPLWRPRCN